MAESVLSFQNSSLFLNNPQDAKVYTIAPTYFQKWISLKTTRDSFSDGS